MRILLAMGLGVSVLAAVGVVIFAGAACTGMSHRGDMDGHQHGDMAMMAGDQPAATPVFVNTKCPIMGGAINPAKVPESLTREYKGQKVAFCCPMCPPQWDKLTDAQKDAKLQAVVAK